MIIAITPKAIINKVEAGTDIRMDSNLQKLCYQWMLKNSAIPSSLISLLMREGSF